jgi:hypothetical protein
MNIHELLIEKKACQSAMDWAKDYETIEQIVENVHRGDWLLWLAKKIDIPIKTLTLAKARCAKTVIHLMKDQRSIDAVNLAERFGLTDEVILDDLKIAYAAAACAADAAYAAADAAAACAYARIKNQNQTANICREILGGLIIDKVNGILNSK